MARYRGPSDASVAISGILSGLAAVERGYRAEARDKDKFREALILQDRKTQYLGEQARADRELRTLEFKWKTLTDDKKYALDYLETLDAERADLALSDAEWKSFKYFDKTGDFQDISSAYTASNDEKTDEALSSYTNTEKDIQNLMTSVEMINTNIRISKEFNRKIAAMSSELGAELPGFYEKYRDYTPADAGVTEVERLKRAFTVEDTEMNKIYEALKLERPDMFGDIDKNEVLQDLIRREIGTHYSTAIQRATGIQTMHYQAKNQKIAEEAAITGDYGTLQSSLLTGANLALEQMSYVWQHIKFQPGEDGVADANKAISSLFEDLTEIPGLPEAQAKAISEMIVDLPANQYIKIGPLMANVFSTLQSEDATAGDITTARAIEAALVKNGVYGYMDDEDKKTFTTQLGIFYTQRDLLQKAVASQGEYLTRKLGIDKKKNNINTNKALEFINQDKEPKTSPSADISSTGGSDSSGTGSWNWAADNQSETVSSDTSGTNVPAIIDSIDAIDNSEAPLLNEIINNNAKGPSAQEDWDANVPDLWNDNANGETLSDFTHLPMWGDNYNPPLFMENYDFGGYSKPGVFGIGGGEPMWINKETGAVTSTPSEMTWAGPDDRQLYQAYEMQLEADYRGASEYKDTLQDLAEANAKVSAVKAGFSEGHPRRNQRLLKLQSEIDQIQNSLNIMELASPQYVDMKYYEGK